VSGWLERTGSLFQALRRRRHHDARIRWSRDRLEAYQRQRLDELVRWAAERSPFYRRLYGGLPGAIELERLPIVTKSAMMENFDDFVTDPRVTLAALRHHLQEVVGDERFLGELRVMSSSGSSGQKAVFVYDRPAWRDGFLHGNLRMSAFAGIAPTLPRRTRLASVAAPDGKHMTFRGSAALDVGLFATCPVPATLPPEEIATRLEAFRPDFIFGYPSVLALIAELQLAGKVRLAPRGVITSSEVRTDAMTARMRAAWGIEPFNCLGLTETGIAAGDCSAHRGLHVFEDLCILEAVDEEGRPVPDGQAGSKLLVTNLYNRLQPIIRYEVSDLVTLEGGPCPCGVSLRRIVALDGRSDDILELPGLTGTVRVHPLHLRGALARDPRVVQYQVVHDHAGLEVQVVLAGGADADAACAVAAALEAALRARGAVVAVRVRAVREIAREAGAGKLKLVRAATLHAPSA